MKKFEFRPFENLHVLLAEDNEINAMVISTFLEDWGAACTIAFNGEEAVAAIRRGHFDIILMDIYMPKMSGLEAIIEILKTDCDAPIIVLTGTSDEDDITKAMKLGANDYLRKPIEKDQLFQMINKQFT